MGIWITSKVAAELCNCTERNIRLKKDELRIKQTKNSKGTRMYLIDLTSLPHEAQQEYIKRFAEYEEAGNETVIDSGSGVRTYTMGELKEIFGEDKFEEHITEALRKVEIIKKLDETALQHGQKGAEVKKLCKDYDTSPRSVARWKEIYEKDGLMGLIRKPSKLRGQSTKLSEDAISFIRGFYLKGFKPKGSHVFRQYLKKANQEGWPVVGKDLVYREIAKIPKAELVMGRRGKEEYNKQCMPKATRDLSNLLINQIWCPDGHTIAVLSPNGDKVIRLTFSAFQDMRCRAIVGLAVGIHSSSQLIGLAFRHGVLPKPDSPFCGLPGQVYSDNGKDYKSNYFTAEQIGLFDSLEIDHRLATPRFPWTKPIERFFQDFSNNMSKYVYGYCAEDIKDRPFDFNSKDIVKAGITADILIKIVLGYINTFNNTKHSGLGGKTPLQVYQEVPKFRHDMPTSEELDILLLKAKKYSAITPSGIKMFNHWYWADELMSHIGKKGTVRYDPDNIGELLVYVGGELLCKATSKELLTMDASEDKIKEWRKKQANERKRVSEQIASYGISDSEVRRMMLEDYLEGYEDKEEILKAVTGATLENKSSGKVVRLNKNTHEGRKKKQLDIGTNLISGNNEYFEKLGNELLKNVK